MLRVSLTCLLRHLRFNCLFPLQAERRRGQPIKEKVPACVPEKLKSPRLAAAGRGTDRQRCTGRNEEQIRRLKPQKPLRSGLTAQVHKWPSEGNKRI